MFSKIIFLLFLPFCFGKTIEVTFKDVTFRGYSVFTEKFKKTIPNGNKLKDFLPNSVFDAIEFKDQNIPIFYKDSLADLEDLDELVIEFCNVEDIRPGAISNADSLRKLSLKGNKIKSIEKGVFNSLGISTLDLSLNEISYIHPQALNNLPELLNINLADNLIQKWNPEWLDNTPILTRISIQNNSIDELPANSFKHMTGEKKFGKLDLTINLVFSHNKIHKIDPQAFSGLKKINNLWLDNNVLEDFDENLLNGIQVEDLRLNKNNIECFKGNLDKVLKAETNHIDSNPFDCVCLEQIKEWSQKKKNVDFSYSEMDCIAKRVRVKLTLLEKRLKELKNEKEIPNEVEEIEVFENKPKTLKYKNL
ncbi:phospholipase A2 inhibitor-like [Diorhabda carinulata]|uniref:phospholipase A2 inhibitor-like n=1 Tax=Diorhabda carinulata TaxID=1163345 RepID=UPI0025A1AB8B|nr:phospholipase A2 inhibitor-like [Diorhabda carinulata]